VVVEEKTIFMEGLCGNRHGRRLKLGIDIVIEFGLESVGSLLDSWVLAG